MVTSGILPFSDHLGHAIFVSSVIGSEGRFSQTTLNKDYEPAATDAQKRNAIPFFTPKRKSEVFSVHLSFMPLSANSLQIRLCFYVFNPQRENKSSKINLIGNCRVCGYICQSETHWYTSSDCDSFTLRVAKSTSLRSKFRRNTSITSMTGRLADVRVHLSSRLTGFTQQLRQTQPLVPASSSFSCCSYPLSFASLIVRKSLQNCPEVETKLSDNVLIHQHPE